MNLLLVDDDKIFIRKTIEGIDWESIGIQRVFTAENMEQACKVLETFDVDVVVTDVEMPQGSGLELLEWIGVQGYPVENIVISGYAHFAYAQKAMEFGSRKYMLKPVSSKELTAAISELLQEMQGRKKEGRGRFSNGLQKILDSMGEGPGFLRQVREIKEYLGEKDLFQIVLLRALTNQKREDTEQKLLEFAVQNIVRELFKDSERYLELVAQESGSEWLLLIRQRDAVAENFQEIPRIQNCLREMVQIVSCAFVSESGTPDQLEEIYQRFQSQCRQIIGQEQKIIVTREWIFQEEFTSKLDFGQVERKLLEGKFGALKRELTEYIDRLVKDRQATRHNFEDFLEGLNRSVHHFLEETEIPFDRLFGQEELAQKKQNAFINVAWMYEFINDLMDTLEGAQQLGGNRQEQLVHLLKQYIDAHLAEELSRKKLASRFHFSEDYLAKLFRIQTGRSISGYVMERRMELAKEYLADTDKPISEIALMVGYSNFSYFSKSFRDYAGKVPNEYRVYIKNQTY